MNSTSSTETTSTTTNATVGAQAAPVAPAKAKASKGTKAAKKAAPAAAPREGSKKQIVIGMLRAKGGATLGEIMKKMGWQRHTVRGFVSGMLGKKMGLTVESTRSESGDRTYKIAK